MCCFLMFCVFFYFIFIEAFTNEHKLNEKFIITIDINSSNLVIKEIHLFIVS